MQRKVLLRTGKRIATASVRTGFAMTWLFARGRHRIGVRTGASGPTDDKEICASPVRADVGSELSAAGGRGSEVSEWPRSKFPASAVRQRRNFGHRNRIIGPYGCFIRYAAGGVIWLRYGRRNTV